MILRVHHSQITIPEGSENEARTFYTELLGIREVPKPEALQGRGGFWLEVDGFQIHVGLEDNVDRSRSKAHVAYLVDDIKAWRAKLTAAEIDVIEGIPIPGYDRFEFRDPFGNRVEFLQTI